MIRFAEPAVLVLRRAEYAARLERAAREHGHLLQQRVEDDRLRIRSEAKRKRVDALVMLAPSLVIGAVTGAVAALAALLLVALDNSTIDLPDAPLIAAVWALAALALGWIPSLASAWPRLASALAAFAGGRAVAALLPDEFPDTAGLAALTGLGLVVAFGIARTARRPERAGRPEAGPAVRPLPAHHVDSSTALAAQLVEASRSVGRRIDEQRHVALDAAERGVASMREMFDTRRHSGFWTAVEATTAALADLQSINERALEIARAWSGGAARDVLLLRELRQAHSKAGVELGGASTLRIDFDDGSHELCAVYDSTSSSSGSELLLATLPGRFTLPRTELDRAGLARLERVYAQYAELLVAADGDFEFASIGQQFLTRQTLREGFGELARTIASVGASICAQVRSSEAAVSANIAQASQTVAAAAAASANEQRPLRDALGRMENHSSAIQRVYVVNP